MPRSQSSVNVDKPHLQGAEPESIAGVLDVRAVEPSDEGLDSAIGFPWRLRKPTGKEHVVLGFQLAKLGFEQLQVAFEVGRLGRHRALVLSAG